MKTVDCAKIWAVCFECIIQFNAHSNPRTEELPVGKLRLGELKTCP